MAVYLLRFERAIGNPEKRNGTALYYLGYADDGNLADRIIAHWNGSSKVRIIDYLRRSGIGFTIARVWWGEGRTFERKLKNGSNYRRLDKTRPYISNDGRVHFQVLTLAPAANSNNHTKPDGRNPPTQFDAPQVLTLAPESQDEKEDLVEDWDDLPF